MDAFLKFADKADAEAVFSGIGVGVNAIDGKLYSHVTLQDGDMLIDVVFGDGVIYIPTGNMIELDGGMSAPEMKPSDGYHVNVRWTGETLPEALVPYALNPNPTLPKCAFSQ